MATITSTPTADSLTVSGTTQASGTISWSKPTIPSGATISSCVLTGTATASMSRGSATITVNGTTVTSGSQFTINLETANNTISVTTTAKGGNKNSAGTVSFSNLVYTVTYEEAAQVKTYTVTFKDWDGTTLKAQTVEEGASAIAPSNPSRTGYTFIGWDKDFSNITSDLTVIAQYAENGGLTGHTVTFVDWDGTILKTELVEDGGSATAPSNPTRTGYIFIGWDVDFSNVTSNLTITAQYIDAGGSDVKKNLFPSFKNEWTPDSYDLVYLIAYDDYSAEITINDSNTGLKSSNISEIQGKIIRLGAEEFYGTSSKMMLYYTDGSCEDKIIDKDNTEVTINVQDKPCYLYILDTENNNLTTLYDAYLYIEGDSSEEPEKDIIEWTGIGTVATNISNEDDWTYKLNMDWNTQYVEINNIVAYGEAFSYGADVLYMNNEYNFTTGETFYIDDTETLVINGDLTEFYSFKFSIKISKNDGLVFTSNLDDNTYEIKNYHLIENSSVLYLSSLVRTSGNSYSTIGEIKVVGIEPEEDVIEWTGTGTVATGLNSGIKHSNYKINLDWDNEYFDIILQNYTQTGNGVANTKVCSVRINNNTYDYYFSEDRIVLRQGSIDICECSSYVLPSTLRFAKDGVYCLYEEENVKIGEIEYGDDNVIYILEDDEYSTDFSMNFNLAVNERSSEDIEPEIKQLSLGNLKIDKLYIGETEVTEIYLGEVLVYKNKSTF